jgi:hypothetical protein
MIYFGFAHESGKITNWLIISKDTNNGIAASMMLYVIIVEFDKYTFWSCNKNFIVYF